jgi:hypothetical protein
MNPFYVTRCECAYILGICDLASCPQCEVLPAYGHHVSLGCRTCCRVHLLSTGREMLPEAAAGYLWGNCCACALQSMERISLMAVEI